MAFGHRICGRVVEFAYDFISDRPLKVFQLMIHLGETRTMECSDTPDPICPPAYRPAESPDTRREVQPGPRPGWLPRQEAVRLALSTVLEHKESDLGPGRDDAVVESGQKNHSGRPTAQRQTSLEPDVCGQRAVMLHDQVTRQHTLGGGRGFENLPFSQLWLACSEMDESRTLPRGLRRREPRIGLETCPAYWLGPRGTYTCSFGDPVSQVRYSRIKLNGMSLKVSAEDETSWISYGSFVSINSLSGPIRMICSASSGELVSGHIQASHHNFLHSMALRYSHWTSRALRRCPKLGLRSSAF